MIKKSFEILNNTLIFLKYNLFLIYGENNGLKKDIIENIKKTILVKDSNVEFMSLKGFKKFELKSSYYKYMPFNRLKIKVIILAIKIGRELILKPYIIQQIRPLIKRINIINETSSAVFVSHVLYN